MKDHPDLEDELKIQRRNVLAAERRQDRLRHQELLRPTSKVRK